MTFSNELTGEIYVYDDNLIGIAKNLFKAHKLKVPSVDEFAPITDLIRYNAVNDVSEESPSALGDYLEKAMRYTYVNIHALGIFLYGHDTLESFIPCVADKLSSRDYLPSRYIDDAAKLLARAISDYRININVLLNAPPNFDDKIKFVALWFARNCFDDLPENFDERDFLSLFYDKAYIFSEFLATYYSVLSGKPVLHRQGVPRTPQLEMADWLSDLND